MVDSVFFETLDFVGRSVRNNDLPFGGIQLIVSGDFFQLPPVSKYGQEKRKFCFQVYKLNYLVCTEYEKKNKWLIVIWDDLFQNWKEVKFDLI